jgi:hypothetical protein
MAIGGAVGERHGRRFRCWRRDTVSYVAGRLALDGIDAVLAGQEPRNLVP